MTDSNVKLDTLGIIRRVVVAIAVVIVGRAILIADMSGSLKALLLLIVVVVVVVSDPLLLGLVRRRRSE